MFQLRVITACQPPDPDAVTLCRSLQNSTLKRGVQSALYNGRTEVASTRLSIWFQRLAPHIVKTLEGLQKFMCSQYSRDILIVQAKAFTDYQLVFKSYADKLKEFTQRVIGENRDYENIQLS